eukprot:3283529-Amphidinium_carterae.1
MELLRKQTPLLELPTRQETFHLRHALWILAQHLVDVREGFLRADGLHRGVSCLGLGTALTCCHYADAHPPWFAELAFNGR